MTIAEAAFYVTCWVPLGATGSTLSASLIMLSCIFVVILVFTGGLLFSFLEARRFVKSLLSIRRAVVGAVPCFMAYPTAAVAGLYLADGLKSGGLANCIFGLLAVLQFVGFFVIFYLSCCFWGATPFLPKTPFAAFDITPYIRHTMGICILFLLSIVAPQLQGWFVYAIVGTHLVLSIYLIYYYCYRPFLANWLNIVIQAFSVYGVLMDIANLAHKLIGINNAIFFQIVQWLFMAVAAGIAFTFDCVQEKIVRRVLADEAVEEDREEETLSDDDKRQQYKALKIDESEQKALFYLNYAIARQHLKYFDFAFMKYIINHHTNAHVIPHCARVVSWFPYQAHPLAEFCAQGMGRKDLDFKEEFLLFQLSRIRLLRESSTSISAGEKLTAIKIASNDIILKLRSFWERADCNLALINQWVKQLASVTTQWQEAIDDFPNSLVLRDTYITFLIEAGSRYSDAVYQKSRADLLDNGINFQVGMDSYKRFIAKYPQYLKKRILDVRGNLMNKGRSGRPRAQARA
jgi:hypothetical protein